MTSGLINVLTIEGDLSNFTQCNILSRGIIFKTEIFNGFVHTNVVYIERMHVTSSNSKSKNKEPPKFLSSSSKRDAKFISVYNF